MKKLENQPTYEKSELRPGEVVTLKAVRESEQGLFLDAGTGFTADDILLHKQQQTSSVKVGDWIEVYLYVDPKKRLTASMRLPQLKIGEVGPAKLLGVTKQGAFVDIGAERGLFLPYREMRGKPLIGSLVWVKPYRDKSGRMAATMNVDEEMQKKSISSTACVGDEVEALIWRDGEQGYSGITDEGALAFIHKGEVDEVLKVGEKIRGRVSFLREDGRINLSFRPVKERALDSDGEKIIQFLESRKNYAMPYGDSTSPEVIRDKFGLSKSAFKRALGRLFKEGKIHFDGEWTVLTGKELG